MARTDTLGHFLTDVADAIREKKGTSEIIQASDFDTEIENLPSGGKYAPRYISFQNYTGTELNNEISNLDTSNMTTMKNMFSGCANLTSIDLSNFDTSNVTNMSNMFYGCTNISDLDISDFDINALTNINGMFRNCASIRRMDLKKFVTSNLSGISTLFNNCTSLEYIDISGISNPSSGFAIAQTFLNCTSLQFLDIRNIEFNWGKFSEWTNTFGSVPTDCEIIVKDNTSRNWMKSNLNMSSYTNIKTVAEYEAEQSE